MGTIECPECHTHVDSRLEICSKCGLDLAAPPPPGVDPGKTTLGTPGGPRPPADIGPPLRAEPAATPSPRLLFGRFRVEAELGRGGMGEVYRCFDEQLRRTRAVKLLLPEFARNKEARERFLDEVRTAQEIAHPHVVNVLEYLPDDTQPGFAMELLSGATLAAEMLHGIDDVAGQLEDLRALVEGLSSGRGATE